MQPQAQVQANRGQLSQSPQNNDKGDGIENVIVVRTPPQFIANPLPHSLPSFGATQQSSISSRLSPQKDSPPGQLTPPTFSSASSQNTFFPGQLPSTALPLHPATPNTFLASFGDRGSPAMPPSARGKRKRPSAEPSTAGPTAGPTTQIPGKRPFRSAKNEHIPNAIVNTRAGSAEERTDEDEPENPGKKRKIKGIMKTPAPAVALPSPSVERAELLFDMDRLSIDNDSGDEQEKEQSGNLGGRAGVATDKGKRLARGNVTIPEEHDEDDTMEETTARPIKPLPSRRRLRSPPPPQVSTEEDEDNDEEKDSVQNPPLEDEKDEYCVSPPLPSSPVTLGDEDGDEEDDDEEDLRTGARGIFYYKPTPAQMWARSQKRMEQIKEYKARESRDEREKRRMKRRGSSSAGRTGTGGGISGIGGKLAAAARKVRFS